MLADTLNCLSIDSDQSTSDTLAVLASRRKAVPGGDVDSADGSGARSLARALESVLGALSMDIVRNGEGVQHVMRVRVTGSPSKVRLRASKPPLVPRLYLTFA